MPPRNINKYQVPGIINTSFILVLVMESKSDKKEKKKRVQHRSCSLLAGVRWVLVELEGHTRYLVGWKGSR